MTILHHPRQKSSETSGLDALSSKRSTRFERKAAKMRSRIGTVPGVIPPRLPPDIAVLFEESCQLHGVSMVELTTPGKTRRNVTRARRFVVLRLRAQHFSWSDSSRYLRIHHTSALHLVLTASARERELALAAIKRSEERQKQIERIRIEPLNIEAWDEWI